MGQIVSVKWLNENLKNDNLVILDGSMDAVGSIDGDKLKSNSIPGARFFDLKNVFSNQNSPFPNTIPSPEQFEMECQNLGINNDSFIIVYDNKGIYSSPRVWWLFKVMGHENIAVLNGGLPEWIAVGNATEEMADKSFPIGNFKANFQNELLKEHEDILSNIDSDAFQVIDARSEGRFNGSKEDPRKNLKSGHIPNSINVHYQSVIENGKFKSKEELQEIFKEIKQKGKQTVFSCGSGITACIIMLAYEIAYEQSRFLYDGSWTEWAEKNQLWTN